MKKLFILMFMAVLASSCVCTLGQIPPQVLYVDENCECPLPDYTTKVVVSDNCVGTYVLKQTPIAGTVLNGSTPALSVVITATDAFGNVSKPLNVPVTLVDTIPPILNWPVSQIEMTEDDLVNMYANWEAAVKVHGIAKWMYDRTWQNGLTMIDTAIIDSCGNYRFIQPEYTLRYFHNTIRLSDEEYEQYVAIKKSNE